ncbi:hypothetical protein BOX15_Mlig029594g2 [Macrostomum lignano]|uniref:Ubiquitin fusion degradation protein 1 homolog n=1 Tax=Macrostomum lignano TaxID=282301 RepID=A0A267DL70_9PLAT|nr:hypothetical protein BOX15_Mlig029594g2 [Macrostomum lignano]
MFNRFVFGGGPGPQMSSTFETTYRCYSASMFTGQDKVRQEAQTGGKIIMPQSALESLVQLHIQYPMIFRLSNPVTKKFSHAGVIEFTAEEGRVYVPYWIMQNLLLNEGDMLRIENVSLPKATYAKFQPQNVNFLDISNPKAVLENELRKFACLSTGDIIVLHYNNKEYELLVQELKPANSVTIIECDVNVEFDKPVGYEESTVPKSASQASLPSGAAGGFTDGLGGATGLPLIPGAMEDLSHQPVIPEGARNPDRPAAFPGAGQRLDGKLKSQQPHVFSADGATAASSSSAAAVNGGLTSVDSSSSLNSYSAKERGVPNYDYRPGELHFIRKFNRGNGNDNAAVDGGDAGSFKAFDGAGMRLKTARTAKQR